MMAMRGGFWFATVWRSRCPHVEASSGWERHFAVKNRHVEPFEDTESGTWILVGMRTNK